MRKAMLIFVVLALVILSGCGGNYALPSGKVLEVFAGGEGYSRHCWYTVTLELGGGVVQSLQNVCGPPPVWKGMEFTGLEYRKHVTEPYITITKVYQKQK